MATVNQADFQSGADAPVRARIDGYFQSYLAADAEGIARAFHPETRLYSTSESGALEKTELAEWLANLRDRSARGDIRQGTLEIASLDVVADSAIAKARLRIAGRTFTDLLSLLRIDGDWRIIGKVYTVIEG